MDYLTWKLLHVISATVIMGTGTGIAFFMWMAHRSRNITHIAHTSRLVVIADSIFTAPAVVFQLLSGLWMVHHWSIPWDAVWIQASLGLYIIMMICWLPVVVMQIKIRNLAWQSMENGTPLSEAYYRLMRRWFWLGWPAVIAVLFIFVLMIKKPYVSFF